MRSAWIVFWEHNTLTIKTDYKLVIVDTRAAPALHIVGQQYPCSLCSSLKYTDKEFRPIIFNAFHSIFSFSILPDFTKKTGFSPILDDFNSLTKYLFSFCVIKKDSNYNSRFKRSICYCLSLEFQFFSSSAKFLRIPCKPFIQRRMIRRSWQNFSWPPERDMQNICPIDCK